MAKSKDIEPKTEEIKSEVQVFATHEVQKGVYSNLALIHHTENEFIFDFISWQIPVKITWDNDKINIQFI